MNKKKIGIIILVIVVIYLLYVAYKYFGKGEVVNVFTNEPIIINTPKEDTSGNISNPTPKAKTNFELIQLNTGGKPDSNNIVKVYFNSGKNFAQVYSNGRYYIYKADKTFVGKGSYREGGKELYPDYGTPVMSTNVFNNFVNVLPKQSLTSTPTYS